VLPPELERVRAAARDEERAARVTDDLEEPEAAALDLLRDDARVRVPDEDLRGSGGGARRRRAKHKGDRPSTIGVAHERNTKRNRGWVLPSIALPSTASASG
jgi:hypothetical protein